MPAILHRWFVFLGAAFMLLLAAGSASASCGDYLHVAGEEKNHPTQPAPKPCDGPHCSQQQVPPAPPEPVPPPTFSDDSCCATSREMNSTVPHFGWLEIVESSEPHFLPDDVFDPPR